MIYADPVKPLRDTRRFLFCLKRASTLAAALCAAILVAAAPQALALMSYSLDEPIQSRKANSAVDIIYDGEYIWLATPRGVSGTSDRGVTWITYDASTGLNSSDISAIAFDNGILWVASAHNVVIEQQSYPWGDGFNFAAKDGWDLDWQSSQPFQATDANMLAYDISVLDSIVWAPCFAGGLIASFDRGLTWRNVFADSTDSVDMVDKWFDERSNLYYATVADTFYQDSVVLWAGSAEGVHKYVYIDETRKIAGMRVLDISYDRDSTMWFAADGGVSRGATNNGITYVFRSWDSDQGMVSDLYTTIEADSGLVVAAARDPETGEGLGFSITTDNGQSWYVSQPDQASGPGNFVNEIVIVGDAIFAACSEGGLIRSTDHGASWEQMYLFPGDMSPDNPYNRYYSLFPEWLDGDSVALWTGSDTGIVVFTFADVTGEPAGARHIPLADTDTSGQHVEAILVWDLDTTLIWDIDTVTQQIWIATYPVDPGGIGYRVMRSVDGGMTWDYPTTIAKAHDIALRYDRILIGLTGSMLSDTSGRGEGEFESIQIGSGATSIDSAFRRIEVADPAFWIATGQGAIRWGPLPTGEVFGFTLERVNTDPTKYDMHYQYTAESHGLSGNWVTALGLQYHDGVKTIWAATHATEEGTNGITSTTNNGADWIVREREVQAWNFAFDGGDVYFASYQGVFGMPEGEHNFSRIPIKEASGREISNDAEFYSCRVVGNDLWVGSSDGIAVMGIDTVIFRDFRNIENFEGGEPYASPVPVSPTRGLGFVRFHYHLPEPARVTIKVYDFAMNLVRLVVDNEFREPREAVGGVVTQIDDDTWDLRNGKGDRVAAGVYFFLVETSTGRQDWGKIMVLP